MLASEIGTNTHGVKKFKELAETLLPLFSQAVSSELYNLYRRVFCGKFAFLNNLTFHGDLTVKNYNLFFLQRNRAVVKYLSFSRTFKSATTERNYFESFKVFTDPVIEVFKSASTIKFRKLFLSYFFFGFSSLTPAPTLFFQIP